MSDLQDAVDWDSLSIAVECEAVHATPVGSHSACIYMRGSCVNCDHTSVRPVCSSFLNSIETNPDSLTRCSNCGSDLPSSLSYRVVGRV